MNPKMLPTWLPDSLAQQLYTLPDSYGVLVWFDHFGKAQAIEAHERAYSETATLLHSKKLPPHIKAAASIRFIPAVGQLHTLWLKAQTMHEYQLMPSEKSTSFSTVRFIADEHGSLQARIVLLNSGIETGVHTVCLPTKKQPNVLWHNGRKNTGSARIRSIFCRPATQRTNPALLRPSENATATATSQTVSNIKTNALPSLPIYSP